MAGHWTHIHPGVQSSMYEEKPQFSGFMRPCRFEGEISNLQFEGSIPAEIDGTFYRVMPDPHQVPFVSNDPWFNGDGNVSAFNIKDGRCDFKQRYVRTEKFVREAAAGRALVGKYRNKYTDAVAFRVRSTANTNVIYFNGKLLACKEDSPPYAMDPKTLETVGLEDFDGQLPSFTFTAHPKIDPVSKELIGFGYEALGDGTSDICYFTISADGKFTQSIWMKAPVVAMIHDFAVTENWVLFPLIPQTCDLERMKQGGEHWQWDANIPLYIGVLPRYGGSNADVKWFEAPNAFPGHTLNAFEDEQGRINFDLPLCDVNVMYWWPDIDGNAPAPEQITSPLVRFNIDPQANSLTISNPCQLVELDNEFGKIDDRWAFRRHRHSFFLVKDITLPTNWNKVGPRMGGGYPPYNSLAHFDEKESRLTKYFPGPMHFVQEPVFICRKGNNVPEGDGWVVALVNNMDTMLSELHVIDTRNFEKPQAIIHIGIRLRPGLHGNWVDAEDVK